VLGKPETRILRPGIGVIWLDLRIRRRRAPPVPDLPGTGGEQRWLTDSAHENGP
jgi:hypothetical protein